MLFSMTFPTSDSMEKCLWVLLYIVGPLKQQSQRDVEHFGCYVHTRDEKIEDYRIKRKWHKKNWFEKIVNGIDYWLVRSRSFVASPQTFLAFFSRVALKHTHEYVSTIIVCTVHNISFSIVRFWSSFNICGSVWWCCCCFCLFYSIVPLCREFLGHFWTDKKLKCVSEKIGKKPKSVSIVHSIRIFCFNPAIYLYFHFSCFYTIHWKHKSRDRVWQPLQRKKWHRANSTEIPK